MDKKMKIIALIALLAYVISPVDLAPGPMDDMIMCLLYAIMNYKSIPNEVLDENLERHHDQRLRWHARHKAVIIAGSVAATVSILIKSDTGDNDQVNIPRFKDLRILHNRFKNSIGGAMPGIFLCRYSRFHYAFREGNRIGDAIALSLGPVIKGVDIYFIPSPPVGENSSHPAVPRIFYKFNEKVTDRSALFIPLLLRERAASFYGKPSLLFFIYYFFAGHTIRPLLCTSF